MSKWYYARGGQQSGPISDEEIGRLIASGELPGDSLVWADGMASWVEARSLPQFATLFGGSRSAGSQSVRARYASQGGYATPDGGTESGTPLAYESHGGADALTVSPLVLQLLQQTKPWARFMSVMMFIGGGLMVLSGLLQFIGLMALSGMSRRGPGPVAAIGVVGPLLNFALGSLYIVPAIYLGRFATRIGNLIHQNRQRDFEAALEAQKSFWKFTGILTLVAIGVVLIVLLIALIGVGMMASR